MIISTTLKKERYKALAERRRMTPIMISTSVANRRMGEAWDKVMKNAFRPGAVIPMPSEEEYRKGTKRRWKPS